MKPAKKGILCSLMGLLLLMGFIQFADAAQKLLAIPLRVQEQDQWCWAGCSNSVLRYFKKTIAQCYIADFAWTRNDCCPTPANCNSPNSMYGDAGSIQGILNHWCISSTGVAKYLTFAQCQTEINASRPFIIRYGWDSGGGHFIVGRGYKTDTPGFLYLMNPWPGDGYGTFRYSYVKRKVGDHTWTHTLKGIQADPDPADWKVANTAPTKEGDYWNFDLSVAEIQNGCGMVKKFYWDFYDEENVFITRQYNTAADFAAWFDDCGDGDSQLPRLTKFCASLWVTLGGRPSGYVRLSFVIKCDSGTTITRRSKKIALPDGAGGQESAETPIQGYGTPAAGPAREAAGQAPK